MPKTLIWTPIHPLFFVLEIAKITVTFVQMHQINLKTKNQEFIEWKWISPELLPDVIVEFKKEMYLALLKYLKKFIN